MAQPLKEKIIGSLSAPDSHVSPAVALEDLTAAQARRRPGKRLATIWEQLAHLVFWQEFVLETVRGGNPRPPATAEGGWPPMPPARGAANEWDGLKARFAASLGELQRIALVHYHDLPHFGTPPGSHTATCVPAPGLFLISILPPWIRTISRQR